MQSTTLVRCTSLTGDGDSAHLLGAFIADTVGLALARYHSIYSIIGRVDRPSSRHNVMPMTLIFMLDMCGVRIFSCSSYSSQRS